MLKSALQITWLCLSKMIIVKLGLVVLSYKTISTSSNRSDRVLFHLTVKVEQFLVPLADSVSTLDCILSSVTYMSGGFREKDRMRGGRERGREVVGLY